MDFSTKNKKQLKVLADELEVEVEAKKKGKPTTDELITALELFEKENGEEIVELAAESLGIDEDDTLDEEAPVKGQIYTYVGKGETSPQRIKLMGRQEFVRGRPTEVTDPIILSKIDGISTFVKGKAGPELLQAIEDEGIAQAEKNRKIDAQMDANFKKQHGGKGE